MKLIHRSSLKYDSKINLSVLPPIIGSLFILPWGYAIFTIMYVKFPIFIFIVNLIIYPIFLIILLKQYAQLFQRSSKFVVAFNGSNIILPLNHAIKSPDDDKDYFLSINLSEDVKKIELIKESRRIPTRNKNQSIRTQTQNYFKFNLGDSVAENILSTHKLISNTDGFSGSPVFLGKATVEFHLKSGTSKVGAISKALQKRGLFSGRYKRKSIDLEAMTSWPEIQDEFHRMHTLGHRLDTRRFLKELVKKQIITKQQMNSLLKRHQEIEE